MEESCDWVSSVAAVARTLGRQCSGGNLPIHPVSCVVRCRVPGEWLVSVLEVTYPCKTCL